MQNHVFSNPYELYKKTHCAHSKPNYLFYGIFIVMLEEGTQKGDPQSSLFFVETIQMIVNKAYPITFGI